MTQIHGNCRNPSRAWLPTRDVTPATAASSSAAMDAGLPASGTPAGRPRYLYAGKEPRPRRTSASLRRRAVVHIGAAALLTNA